MQDKEFIPIPRYALCRACGYSLYRLTVARCPECGTAFDPENEMTWRDAHPKYQLSRTFRKFWESCAGPPSWLEVGILGAATIWIFWGAFTESDPLYPHQLHVDVDILRYLVLCVSAAVIFVRVLAYVIERMWAEPRISRPRSDAWAKCALAALWLVALLFAPEIHARVAVYGLRQGLAGLNIEAKRMMADPSPRNQSQWFGSLLIVRRSVMGDGRVKFELKGSRAIMFDPRSDQNADTGDSLWPPGWSLMSW